MIKQRKKNPWRSFDPLSLFSLILLLLHLYSFSILFKQNKLSHVIWFFFASLLSYIYDSCIFSLKKKKKFKDTIKNIFDGKTRLKQRWFERYRIELVSKQSAYKTLKKKKSFESCIITPSPGQPHHWVNWIYFPAAPFSITLRRYTSSYLTPN